MQKNIPIFFFSILLLSLSISLGFSQNTTSFNKIGLRDGLSQASVLTIHQDHLSRMWFGTRGGLNMWDGERMQTFHNLENDSTGLPSKDIIKIKQQKNFLWLLSPQNIVCRFNISTMKTERFSINHQDITLYNNKVLITTSKGLYEFDNTQNSFVKSEFYQTSNSLSKLSVDNENNLWLSDKTKGKILKLNTTGKTLKAVKLPYSNADISCLVAEGDELLIGTRKKGITRWNFKKNTVNEINLDFLATKNTSNSIYSILKDGKNKYWVATLYGLVTIDFTVNSNNPIIQKTNHPYLNKSAIVSLFLDKNNYLWSGSYFWGVFYSNLISPVYRKHKLPKQFNNAVPPIVGEIVSDNKNNLWIGSEGGGLLYLDKDAKKIKEYIFNKKNIENYRFNIKSLCLAEEHLLIGKRDGGISVLNLKTNQFKEQKISPKKINRDPIHAIVEYKNDFLLATSHGLIKYNLDGSYSLFIKPKDLNLKQNFYFVTAVLVDRDGVVWFDVKGKGLFSYDEKNNLLTDYSKKSYSSTPLKIDEVSCLYQDNFDNIWIGTSGSGLIIFDKDKNTFKFYNKKNSDIASNFICGVKESRFGKMWISTRSCLSLLDLDDNKFYNYKNKFGFPLDEINLKSLYLDNEGELFIGGLEGLISANEENLIYNFEKPKVIFTSLHVNNKEILVNDASKLLTTHISSTKELSLNPIHTSFKIGFSSCNYNTELKNNYQYKLEGFDKNWIDSDGQTIATYTNLTHGKYTLLVRATDMANSPISDTTKLSIIVNPPLTKTWYAYLFYIFLTITIIVLINKFYLKQMKLVYQVKDEKAENKRIQDLNKFKLMFFTNVSHEFMTPLTMILNAIEHLIFNEKTPSKYTPYLKQAYRNSKRLKNLNRELLDFRKVEQGHLKLSTQENNIVSYLNEVFDSFKELADKKNIEYTLKMDTEKCLIYYDPKQMDKVFYNLLSNSFNYTNKENGKVNIDIIENDKNLLIKVIDNGNGISKNNIDRIFDRFYYTENNTMSEYSGSGIGLALSKAIIKEHGGKISCVSEIGKGTTFTVELLKGKEHLKRHNISIKKQKNQFLLDKDLIPNADLTLDSSNTSKKINKSKLTTLLVEDNIEIQSLIKNLLIDKYNIIIANNGEEGIQKATNIQPDLIISDVMMPIMSGNEMCLKLKRNINTSHIPIIMLTALSSDEDRVHSYESGADAYITKPFSSKTLIARIDNIFKNRNKIQTNFKKDIYSSIKTIATDKVDKEFIEKAKKICEENLSNINYGVDQFSKEMGMSRTLFFSKIKSITGQTPNDFIKTLRLKKAAMIISTSATKNITDIAYETGFNSPNYFSKCFKQHFGVKPSDYKNTNS